MRDKGKIGKIILIAVYAILALLSIGYGAMVKAVGSGTGFFFIWFCIGAIFVFFAVAVHFSLWSKLPKAVKGVFLAVLAIGLCFFVVVEAMIISHLHERGEESLDYIIVLGAQVTESGPSPILSFRLDAAIDYLNENPNTICIVSGGQGANEPFEEAVVMAIYLEMNGIDSDRIIEEPKSKTTEENIQNSLALMEEDSSVGIVTNNFHVFRALQIAKDAGIENPSGIAAYSPAAFLPNNLFREFLGEVKYMITRAF